MNMLYFFILVTFTISCSSSMNTIDGRQRADELDMYLSLERDYSLKIIFKNSSGIDLRLSDPKCYVNSRIEIRRGQERIEQSLKVKPDVECAETLVNLKSGEKKSFLLPYRINDMFQLDKNVEYDIHITYIGGITNSEGKPFQSELQGNLTFEIE